MKLVRDSSVLFGGSIASVVVTLMTTPFLLSLIGAERYGALALVWLLLGYFGQADFGLGRATTKRIAELEGSEPRRVVAVVCSAFFSILMFSAVITTLGYITAAWFFTNLFNASDVIRFEILASTGVIALCIPVVAVFGVANGCLQGKGYFGLSAGAAFVGNAALQLFPLAVAATVANDLTTLIFFSVLGRILGLVIALVGVWLVFLRGARLEWDKSEVRKLFGTGKWIMITAIVGPLMIVADRFAIGVAMGAALVAIYTIPFQAASRALLLPIAVTQAMFPRFVSMDGKRANQQVAEYSFLIAAFFAPIVIVLMCLAYPLLAVWLGEGFDTRSALVAKIVLAGIWVNGAAHVPYSFLQARGEARFVGLLHAIELPLYVGLLLYLGSTYGLAGFAAAFSLRCLVDFAALLAKAGVPLGRSLLKLSQPAILIVLALATTATDWIEAGIWAIVLGTTSTASCLFVTPKKLQDTLIDAFKKRFKSEF